MIPWKRKDNNFPKQQQSHEPDKTFVHEVWLLWPSRDATLGSLWYIHPFQVPYNILSGNMALGFSIATRFWMSTNTILVCKAPSLKDTKPGSQFHNSVLQLSLTLFPADIWKCQDISKWKTIYLLALAPINFADKVSSDLTDLNAIYLVSLLHLHGRESRIFSCCPHLGCSAQPHLQHPCCTQWGAARHRPPLLEVLKVSRGLPRESEEDEVEWEAGAAGPGYCTGRRQCEDWGLYQRLRREPGVPAGHSRRSCPAEIKNEWSFWKIRLTENRYLRG